jgi:hypothetical protein
VKRLLIALTVSIALPILGAARSPAQSIDDLNLQVHGYATQGFLFTTTNNWNTTDSSDGSAAWTEAVINVSSRPLPRLRIGVQGRYLLLGYLTNAITLDWAQADYKLNERFGFRAGKVKTPIGLLNESQDIDPAHIWVLLPQSLYALANRNSTLAHYGGVVYGTVPLGESLGELHYRAYGGQRVLSSDDAVFQTVRDKGISLPNGATGPMYGGTVRWQTPIRGLMAGVSEDSEHTSGAAVLGALNGTLKATHFYQPYLYGIYERNKLMVGGEYTRQALQKTTAFVGGPTIFIPKDQRAWYVMASYKLCDKLTGGIYYSSSLDRQLPVSSARYQKDWSLTARFDVNAYLYLKAEQHFVDGTELGYSTSDNTGGLKPNSRMTLLKLGVSF